jgi:hypothetical protein
LFSSKVLARSWRNSSGAYLARLRPGVQTPVLGEKKKKESFDQKYNKRRFWQA